MSIPVKRIFIIDDDASFRQLIARYIHLILPDCAIDECDPSVDNTPLRNCNWQDYDLVLLDYFLSDTQTGLDLLSEWKKLPNFPPVIMLTAAGNEEVAVRAMKSGVYDYLRKQAITKQGLKASILEAVAEHQRERERQQTVTQSSQSFNKTLFYKRLEEPLQIKPGEHGPVLVLLELDNYEVLGEEIGIVTQDNVIRHIAKVAFEVFKDTTYRPVITRITDMAVAMLLHTTPNTDLQADMARLTEALIGNPYEYDGNLIPYTVSIGVVRLQDVDRTVTEIIKRVREACRTVRDRGGNGYHIYAPAGMRPAAGSVAPAPQPKQAPQPKHAPRSQPQPRPQPTPASVEPRPAEETAPAPPPAAAGEPASKSPTEEQPEPANEQGLFDTTLEMPVERTRTTPEKTGETPAARETSPDIQATDLDAAGEQAADADFDILLAFKDNRVLQYYQPVMPLSDKAVDYAAECFSIRVRLVDTDGSLIDAEKVITGLKHVRNQKLLDRWMLRETIGRIIQFGQNNGRNYLFIIKISEESFSDANLFNWLQNKLMKQVAQHDPGRSIVIEVSADTYLAKRRQVAALMKFLRQTYHYRFAVSSFGDIGQLAEVVKSGRFDLVKINHELLKELASTVADADAPSSLITDIRQQGGLIVATFIENATMLTEAINAGADFGMGYFIGEPMERIGEFSQIESFEIT